LAEVLVEHSSVAAVDIRNLERVELDHMGLKVVADREGAVVEEVGTRYHILGVHAVEVDILLVAAVEDIHDLEVRKAGLGQ
jgi:hypothetical protein